MRPMRAVAGPRGARVAPVPAGPVPAGPSPRPSLAAVLLGAAGFPLLLLAWGVLAAGRWLGSPGGPGPLHASAALLLLVPMIALWARAPARDAGEGARSGPSPPRVLSVLGAVGALLLARPEVLLPGLPNAAALGLALAGLAGLAPAARDWWSRLPARPSSARVGRAALDAVVVVILPLALLLAGPVQLFPPPGWVDPGMYLGLALDLPDLVRTYGWNYHALRVSFILPNYVLSALMPPAAARLAAVVAFHLLSLAGLYAGVRLLWGRAPALVAVALLAANPVFLVAVTAGYVDGALIAYALLMFGALAAWHRTGREAWLVAAGALAVLAVLAHLMAAAPVGLLLLAFAWLGRERVAARPLPILGAGLLGAVVAWLFFVYALSRLGFGFDAFRVLGWVVQASVSGIGGNYRVPLGEWLPATTRLVPAALTLAVLGALALARRRRPSRREGVALALALASVLLLPAYDIAFTGSLTQSAFYAGLALPLAAIAGGAMAAALLPAGPTRTPVALAAAALALALGWGAPRLWPLAAASPVPADVNLLGAAALLAAIGALAARRAAPAARALALLAVVAVAGLAAALNPDTRTAYRPPGTVSNAEFFEASVAVRGVLRGAEAEGRVPLFWFDRAGFAARDGRSAEFLRELRFGGRVLALSFYDSLASLRLWDRALLAGAIDAASLDRAMVLRREGTTLLVLDGGAGGLEEALRLLGEAGVACRQRPAAVHESRSFRLRVGLIDVLGERAPAPQCDAPPAAATPSDRARAVAAPPRPARPSEPGGEGPGEGR